MCQPWLGKASRSVASSLKKTSCTPNPGGAGQLIEEGAGVRDNVIRERELELWSLLLNHEGRRELAIDHWSGELTGHARTLARLEAISGGA